MVSTKPIASSDHRAAFALRCDRCAAWPRVSKSICRSEFPESTRACAHAQGSGHSESVVCLKLSDGPKSRSLFAGVPNGATLTNRTEAPNPISLLPPEAQALDSLNPFCRRAVEQKAASISSTDHGCEKRRGALWQGVAEQAGPARIDASHRAAPAAPTPCNNISLGDRGHTRLSTAGSNSPKLSSD